MFFILKNRTYRNLFFAQVVALVGTGLATVALGLLAYDLAGKDAGAVLGTALAIKMVAYVLIAPVAGAYANRLPRRTLLVALDISRLAVVLLLPWVTQIWEIYVLIFVLQSSSAAFTPIFQATIPEVLPDEEEYTRALTLSRLAYDLENLLSPALAAGLLLLIRYQGLFFGTAIGFIGSALLVLSVVLPFKPVSGVPVSISRKLTQGLRIYLATPRLRGLLALTLTAAAGSAMVIVNTVVIVREGLSRPDSAVAIALATYGAGSMTMALMLPRLLTRFSDRAVMLTAGTALCAVLIAVALIWPQLTPPMQWLLMLGGWLLLGMSYAGLVTPSGRLLRRSSNERDRPALFAAQFSLSHACWLIAYPLVGWLGAKVSIAAALWAMAVFGVLGIALTHWLWPKEETGPLLHRHDDLPKEHPHLAEYAGAAQHAHPFVIDDQHERWPSR